MAVYEGVQTDLGLMEATASSVRRTSQELQNLIEQLNSQVTAMQEAAWQGNSGETFREAANAHRTAATALHSLLDELGEAVNYSGVNTGHADSQSGKQIEGLVSSFTMSALRA